MFFKKAKQATHKASLYFKNSKSFSALDRKLRGMKHPLHIYIVGANVVVYFMWNTRFFSGKTMLEHFTLSRENIKNLRFHTLLTYSFSHYNILHFGFNMLAVYSFGRNLEMMFGPSALFKLYMLGALVGGYSALVYSGYYTNTLGASSAVSAMLGYTVMKFPNQQIFFFFIPMPAWLLGSLFFIYSFYNRKNQEMFSNSGHLGGFIAGVGYFYLKKRVLL